MNEKKIKLDNLKISEALSLIEKTKKEISVKIIGGEKFKGGYFYETISAFIYETQKMNNEIIGSLLEYVKDFVVVKYILMDNIIELYVKEAIKEPQKTIKTVVYFESAILKYTLCDQYPTKERKEAMEKTCKTFNGRETAEKYAKLMNFYLDNKSSEEGGFALALHVKPNIDQETFVVDISAHSLSGFYEVAPAYTFGTIAEFEAFKAKATELELNFSELM